MNIQQILQEMVDRRASDLHVKFGCPPAIRVDGELVHLDLPAPTPRDLEAVGAEIMTPQQAEIFQERREVDFAFGLQGVARFRANLYMQRGTVAVAIRVVPLEIPRFETLNLPDIVLELTTRQRGLILVTGVVGSGKSTTLASMIDAINRREARNVITVEDPVEFIHTDQKSLISQREVGLDTESYAMGLRHILRQDPDVILLGEIRDLDTMRVALMAADTGHLVLSTLHTANAPQTVNRILSLYPPHQHGEIRFLLASNLEAIVALRLIQRADRLGRVPACEVLLASDSVREMILDPAKTVLLPQAIAEGVHTYGMRTFDQSLMDLYSRSLVTLDQAVKHASNPTEFQLRVEGIHSAGGDASWSKFETKERKERADEPGADRVTKGTSKDAPEGISRY